MTIRNPFAGALPTGPSTGDYTREEVRLANRNSGIALEALRYDVTPAGLHYLLTHFDIPAAEDACWRLEVGGCVTTKLSLSTGMIKQLPARTMRVTLECAGNGRGHFSPRYVSMPWLYEAVGNAEWTGTPLRHVLEQAGLAGNASEIACIGADQGFDRSGRHAYGRSLKRDHALSDDVLLCTAMNGAPLLPQHGYPLRLIVPGWYGMASVKWLQRIEVLDRPYDGPQQARNYHYRTAPGGLGIPVDLMRVKSLMMPPGIPDWYTRRRVVDTGPVELRGRAWSGGGVPVARVEVAVDGQWRDAGIDADTGGEAGRFGWRGWRLPWQAQPGMHELMCRATDANGAVQPLEPVPDAAGFGNNAVHKVSVFVTAE